MFYCTSVLTQTPQTSGCGSLQGVLPPSMIHLFSVTEACEVDRVTELNDMKEHLSTTRQLLTTAAAKATIIKFSDKGSPK